MPAVARLNDPSSHNGKIVTASTNVLANGLGVARSGDTHSCPVHGPSALNSTSKTLVNGKSVVRVGDAAGCGATITSGSPNVNAS